MLSIKKKYFNPLFSQLSASGNLKIWAEAVARKAATRTMILIMMMMRSSARNLSVLNTSLELIQACTTDTEMFTLWLPTDNWSICSSQWTWEHWWWWWCHSPSVWHNPDYQHRYTRPSFLWNIRWSSQNSDHSNKVTIKRAFHRFMTHKRFIMVVDVHDIQWTIVMVRIVKIQHHQ